MQVLSLESTYQEAAELLEATEAAHHGLDAHSSNGIYLDDSDNGGIEGEEEGAPASPLVGNHGRVTSTGRQPHQQQQGAAGGLGVDVLHRSPSLDLEVETPEANHAANSSASDTTASKSNGSKILNGLKGAARSSGRGMLNSSSVEMEQLPLLGAAMFRATSATQPVHNAQYEVRHRRAGEQTAVRRYYAPTVIPVVQSRESMVIVGAVLRKDIKEALAKIAKLADVAHSTPVRSVLF